MVGQMFDLQDRVLIHMFCQLIRKLPVKQTMYTNMSSMLRNLFSSKL